MVLYSVYDTSRPQTVQLRSHQSHRARFNDAHSCRPRTAVQRYIDHTSMINIVQYQHIVGTTYDTSRPQTVHLRSHQCTVRALQGCILLQTTHSSIPPDIISMHGTSMALTATIPTNSRYTSELYLIDHTQEIRLPQGITMATIEPPSRRI